MGNERFDFLKCFLCYQLLTVFLVSKNAHPTVSGSLKQNRSVIKNIAHYFQAETFAKLNLK
ncbi:MAG: hypothetical protein IKI11_08705 [Neisseriaceae bacterium]|nr:hypothetical protein [Neisseriaceae bacterium]